MTNQFQQLHARNQEWINTLEAARIAEEVEWAEDQAGWGEFRPAGLNHELYEEAERIEAQAFDMWLPNPYYYDGPYPMY